MMKVYELKVSNTNTYLIEGNRGRLLFDTGWAGTFPSFCKCMGDLGIPVQGINYILISHFHPDHMGIAQEIADQGPVILLPEVQWEYVHAADPIFAKEGNTAFRQVDEGQARMIRLEESRSVLEEIGISGEILYTPGHSDDSVSLCLDDGTLFVGDLNPLYELELFRGTQVERSWEMLLSRDPRVVYYGHAKAAILREEEDGRTGIRTGESSGDASERGPLAGASISSGDFYSLVSRIMKYIDKGMPLERIRKKTGAEASFIEDVTRMYLTHPGVSVQGILDRIERKG